MEAGYTDFFSDMAVGTDTWAALAVLALKKENPVLKLHCVLPWEGQADKWTVSARELNFSILEQADEVVYVNQEYDKGCMLKRNRCLVDHAGCLQWRVAGRDGNDGEICQEAGKEGYRNRSGLKGFCKVEKRRCFLASDMV